MKMIRKKVFELKGLSGDQLIYLLDNGASLSMLIDEGADLEAKDNHGYQSFRDQSFQICLNFCLDEIYCSNPGEFKRT